MDNSRHFPRRELLKASGVGAAGLAATYRLDGMGLLPGQSSPPAQTYTRQDDLPRAPRNGNKISLLGFACICLPIVPHHSPAPMTMEEKSVTHVGRAVVQPELRIVNTDKVCGTACARHCPPDAPRLASEGEHKLPAVDTERCTGCGACEVEGNLEHRRVWALLSHLTSRKTS